MEVKYILQAFAIFVLGLLAVFMIGSRNAQKNGGEIQNKNNDPSSSGIYASEEADKEKEFWDWFAVNSDDYYDNLDNDQERLFDLLGKRLVKIDPELSFEFGRVQEDGKREFVISAGGIRSSFPSVMKLVEKAPKFSKWKIVALKPRQETGVVQIGNTKLGIEDLFFGYELNNKRVDIDIYAKNYSKDDNFLSAVYIVLDTLLGEYDMETKVGKIDVKDLAVADRDKIISIAKLPEVVDNYFKKEYAAKENLKISDNWASIKIPESDKNKFLLMLRLNLGISDIAGHPSYPTSVKVTAFFKKPREDGFYSKEEGDDLFGIEDEVFKSFEFENESFVSLIMTGGGKVEYLIYTSDKEKAKVHIEDLGSKFQGYQFKSEFITDDKWEGYKYLLDRTK